MANRLSQSALDGEDVPFTGHAFQWLNTAIDETQTGACDQVFHRARDQAPLARAGERGDTGADIASYRG